MDADVSLISNSFQALFWADHQVQDENLPQFADVLRQESQVMAENQHRWLVMGYAL